MSHAARTHFHVPGNLLYWPAATAQRLNPLIGPQPAFNNIIHRETTEMSPGDGVNSITMEGDTGRVEETRLVHAAADDTLVV